MTFDEYQRQTGLTAVYPGQGTFVGVMYVTGKLNGEAGEVAEEVFKSLRDDHILTSHVDLVTQPMPDLNNWRTYEPGEMMFSFKAVPADRRAKLRKEVGDLLWYAARLCSEFGWSMDEIAQDNLNKLQKRMEAGTLQGSGSNR